jgi:hypothetical protein
MDAVLVAPTAATVPAAATVFLLMLGAFEGLTAELLAGAFVVLVFLAAVALDF